MTPRAAAWPSLEAHRIARCASGWIFRPAFGALLLAAMPCGSLARAATLVAVAPGAGVSVSVPASCGASATPIAFGAYTGVLAVASATVTVTCTGTTRYAVGLDAGTSAGATVTTRRLTGPGGGVLAYRLFQDEARTVNWGEAAGADARRGVGTGAAQTLTVYAAEAAGQTPAPGAYSDTITITVSY